MYSVPLMPCVRLSGRQDKWRRESSLCSAVLTEIQHSEDEMPSSNSHRGTLSVLPAHLLLWGGAGQGGGKCATLGKLDSSMNYPIGACGKEAFSTPILKLYRWEPTDTYVPMI